MKERPILFTDVMVRALLNGDKTQTRRVVSGPIYGLKINPHPTEPSIMATEVTECPEGFRFAGGMVAVGPLPCPYGKPGDRLWVRETWADLEQISDGSFARQAIYRADDIEKYGDEDEYVDVTSPEMRWRPSIHMPRWASRILLDIVSVRVERLNVISEEDCWAEGIEACDGLIDDMKIFELAKRMNRPFFDAAPTYAALWESINGAGSWDANPWVWVVEFRRIGLGREPQK